MDIGSFFSKFVFNSFMINFIMWGMILTVVGYFSYRWYTNRLMDKYGFIEIKNKNNWEFKKGRIVKNDKGIRKFQLKGLEDPQHWLSIDNEPIIFIKGKGYRVVAWDGHGNLAYVNKFDLDKTEYLKTALSQTDRREAVEGQMESNRRNNKVQPLMKWAIGVSIFMMVFSSVTMIMTAKYYFESNDVQSKSTDALFDSTENIKEIVKAQEEVAIGINRFVDIYARNMNLNVSYELQGK